MTAAKGKVRLTKAQRSALGEIERFKYPQVAFPTGEALRRRGLVERHTTYETGWDFASKDGVVPQWRGPGRARHEWFITPAGRAALSPEREGGADG